MKTPINPTPHSHCGFCGSRFTEQDKYPRRCFICWNDTYHNPIPVVIVVMQVYQRDARESGWLIVQRGNEPGKDGWALPGGYIEFGETYQQACAREIKEEVGIETKPEDYCVSEIRNDSGGHLLIFCWHSGTVYQDQFQHFTPNEEVLAIDFPITPDQKELCFRNHQEIWQWLYDYTDN